ncbi:hypothetical protein LZP69_12450 [Shewanella sp. AS1]|uniref:hypothetical protein n=1 Tax=Shewanella sp. AS1 TaxID=2907626 RepID=UPI001F3D567E|nr:hypothetical protein [Shewanella sp. AS1]MCE9679975.1 hypothetical protein [Shewanella sp. AS1]
MEHNKRIVFLICLLVLAFVFYGVGMHNSALGLVIVGALFETIFWLQLFRRSSKKSF